MSARLRNWPGNLTYVATGVRQPETVEQVQELVAASARVKAVGSRHSFSAVADTPGVQISLERLNRVVEIDGERGTVTIEAGMRYDDLITALHAAGYSLHNTASLTRITVAGAVATATHGSGDGNACLATAVSGLELVTADGSLVTLTRERDGERFKGAVVGLGALGVVVRLTLDIAPTYEVRQVVYEGLPVARLGEAFADVMASGYSVSLFTDWRSDHVNQVWVKRRVTDAGMPAAAAELHGSRLASAKLRILKEMPTDPYTEQMDIPGPWHERLPHFTPTGLPDEGAEIQSEYFVPREHAPAAFRALDGIRDRIAPLMGASEVRSIATDDLWMSMFYERDAVAFHFTWLPDWEAVRSLLPVIEEKLAPFDPRPHWGKTFTIGAARLRELYPRMGDFRELVKEMDPAGKFRNAFLDEYVLGGQ
jgi:alditol oxidase